ncbi:hypothetical protein D3C87_740520 [compost metagenome]
MHQHRGPPDDSYIDRSDLTQHWHPVDPDQGGWNRDNESPYQRYHCDEQCHRKGLEQVQECCQDKLRVELNKPSSSFPVCLERRLRLEPVRTL